MLYEVITVDFYQSADYDQFLEHFHRQVFGGAFKPGSPLADGRGFRYLLHLCR